MLVIIKLIFECSRQEIRIILYFNQFSNQRDFSFTKNKQLWFYIPLYRPIYGLHCVMYNIILLLSKFQQSQRLFKVKQQIEHLMEIEQSITYITLNLTGPNYKYVPQKTLNDKYESLQLLYSVPPDKAFIRLIQLCLSDRYLYQHPKIRNKINNHKKGYIAIQEIINLPEITYFIKQVNSGMLPPKSKILSLIKGFHKTCKIHSNLMGIRRREPFINKLENINPLYIEQYPQNDGCEQLQILLQATCNIYKINYNHDENWAVLYAEYPQKIIQLNGHIWSINTKLKVENFQKTSNSFNASNISQSLNSYQKLYLQNKFQKQKGSSYQNLHRGGKFQIGLTNTRKSNIMPFKNQKHSGNRNREILTSYKQFGQQMDFMKDQKEQFQRQRILKKKQLYQEDDIPDRSDQDQDEDEMSMNIYQSQQSNQKYFQEIRMREHCKKQKDGNKQVLIKKMQDRDTLKQTQCKGNIQRSLKYLGVNNIKQQNIQFNTQYFCDLETKKEVNKLCEYSLPKDVQQYIDQTICKRVKGSNNGVMTIIQGVQMYWDDQKYQNQAMDLEY